jgi:hypothetical protein
MLITALVGASFATASPPAVGDGVGSPGQAPTIIPGLGTIIPGADTIIPGLGRLPAAGGLTAGPPTR